MTSKILSNPKSSKAAKSLAASDLSQHRGPKNLPYKAGCSLGQAAYPFTFQKEG